jgi:hypothetical protein
MVRYYTKRFRVVMDIPKRHPIANFERHHPIFCRDMAVLVFDVLEEIVDL